MAKKVITMDPGWPNATAIAVRDGKILSVGSMEDLKPWLINSPYEIIDIFKDKIILPGFIEPHSHPIMGGLMLSLPLLSYFDQPNPYGPTFEGLKSKSLMLAKLGEYNKNLTDPNQTLVAWGYDKIAVGNPLTLNDLDQISTTRPILVWEASEHIMYANSAQLAQAGITKKSTKINGVGTDTDDQPNGQFEGIEALELIGGKVIPPLISNNGIRHLVYMVDLSRKNGITTTSELDFGGIDFETELDIYHQFFTNSSDIPIRFVAVINPLKIPDSQKGDAINYVRSLHANSSTDNMIFNGVKFFSDDAYLALTMQMKDPGYIDGHRGLWNNLPGQNFLNIVLPWWSAGFHIHIHTNGIESQHAIIDMLSSLQDIKPRFDHRFTFEHFGISSQAQIKKLKELGGVVGINPYYIYHRGEINAAQIGTDRAHKASRMRTLLETGVTTTMHSDTPVGPPVPLEWVWIAVNRAGQSGEILAPSERVTIHDALKMITIDAAYVLGVDNLIGSIESGKFADFVILEQDPYIVPLEKIRDISIWGTVVGGKIYPASEIKTTS
jgi:predicted amidohydrolase YtcJ